MKATSIGLCLLLFLALLPAARRSSAAPLGTAFTYQGQLKDGGLPADGVYDLQFRLFDAATAGAQVGSTLAKGDVAVAGGLFVVSLDFGAAPFAGQARFLEIGVRPGASTGAYTLLGARQELTPSPNALHSSTTSDPAVQRRTVAPNCSVGQYIRSIAADGTPTCATDTNSGGTVTSVATGAGLTGGTITGSGTIAVATGGISSAMIAGGAAVKSVNGVADTVTIAGSGGATVSTVGNTITVAAATLPTDCTAPGTVVMGPAGDTTLIGAGYTQAGGTFAEVWMATSAVGAPTERYLHTAVWTGSRMIVWGGAGSVFLVNSGGQYDPVANSWTSTATTGAPSPRSFHTAVWTGSRMIVWGGTSGALENTGGQYDPTSDSWTSTATTAGVPSARRYHTAVWTGSRMVVWGGETGVGVNGNTGGQYDPVSNTWTATATTAGVPSARRDHTAVWTGSRMIVWGGHSGVYENTGGQYDPLSNTWTATATTAGVPTARRYHTAVWTGSQMVVWGGYDNTQLNTGSRYDPTSNTWAATATTAGVPSGRYEHTAVWTGSRMIVWGGFDLMISNTGGAYDPALDSWTATATTPGAPSFRLYHTAVWTASRMIVWGGSSSGQPTNTGGQWFELAYFIKN